MVFWGFVLWFVGAAAGILALLASATGIVDALDKYGFGGYFGRVFDVQYLTAKKIVFAIALLMVIVGLIVFFIGRAKVRRSGVPEKSGARAMKYWRDLKGEYKKITWPTFKGVAKNTGVTLFVCALAAIFICAVDIGLSELVNLLLKL